MLMFYRVMKIVYKSHNFLQFGKLRNNQPTLKFKLSDWLKNDNKESISDFGYVGRVIDTNVWACNSKDIITNFKFSISISAKIIANKSGTEVEFSNFEF